MMNIEYKKFKTDCEKIIGAFLSRYGFRLFTNDSDDYTNIYQNENWTIEVSLLANFPHIGLSFDFFGLKRQRLIKIQFDDCLNVNQNERSEHYKEFSSKNDMNDFPNQMMYCVEVLKKFYGPVLRGEFTYSDYIDRRMLGR